MDLFDARRLPFLSRRNYTFEMQHLLLWGLFVGLFEGTVSSVVVAKTFDAGPWLITIVMATPMLANLAGLIWGALATGRRKKPLFIFFASLAVLAIASVGFTPRSPLGGWIFAGQILIARTVLSGSITVRSSLWKHNYPAVLRGRITARLQLLRYSLAVVTVTTVSVLFDWNPNVYLWVYPSAAAMGLISLALLSRIHVRGEKAELAAMHRAGGGPSMEINPLRLLGGMARALREDRAYARYMLAMMLMGSSNVMLMPVMTIMVTRELLLTYYHSSMLMEVMPQLMMAGSMFAWADLFDRAGAVRFRVINTLVWMAASVAGGVGATLLLIGGIDSMFWFTLVMLFLGLSRAAHGLSNGGAAIAWNLGHLHFARDDRAETYMGAHVFLTGVRGLIAPFVGTWLYSISPPLVFAVAVLLALAGLSVFHRLAEDEARGKESSAAGGIVTDGPAASPVLSGR